MKKLKLNELESTIKSSYRTMALFEFFAEIQRPATVAEICTGLQIPQSSTSTILKSLQDTAFLSFNPETRTYEPTMRMAFLSNWTIQKNANASKLPSILKELREQVQETTVLALRNGIYSQYIFVQHYDDLLGRHVETGSVRPLVTSATGWCLLKDESDFDIGKLIRRTVHDITDPDWQADSENILARINTVRKKGYAVSSGETAQGAAGIAMNLPAKNISAKLAIAVAGPTERILGREQEIIAEMKQAVSKLQDTITSEILGQ